MIKRVLCLCVLGLGCVANAPTSDAELTESQRDGLAELGVARVEQSPDAYFLFDAGDELVGVLDGLNAEVITSELDGTIATVAQSGFDTELACGESRVVRTIDEHGVASTIDHGEAPSDTCRRAIEVYRLLVAFQDTTPEEGARVDALASSGSSCTCVEDYFGNCDETFCHVCIPAHWSSCGGPGSGGGGGGGGFGGCSTISETGIWCADCRDNIATDGGLTFEACQADPNCTQSCNSGFFYVTCSQTSC